MGIGRGRGVGRAGGREAGGGASGGAGVGLTLLFHWVRGAGVGQRAHRVAVVTADPSGERCWAYAI